MMYRRLFISLFCVLSAPMVAQEAENEKTEKLEFRILAGPTIDVHRAIFRSESAELMATNIDRQLRLGLDLQTNENLFLRVTFQSHTLLEDSKFQGVDYRYRLQGASIQVEEHYMLPLLEKHKVGVFGGGQYLMLNSAEQSFWTGNPLDLLEEGMSANSLGVAFGFELESQITKSIAASFFVRQGISLANFEIEGNQSLHFNSTSAGVILIVKR